MSAKKTFAAGTLVFLVLGVFVLINGEEAGAALLFVSGACLIAYLVARGNANRKKEERVSALEQEVSSLRHSVREAGQRIDMLERALNRALKQEAGASGKTEPEKRAAAEEAERAGAPRTASLEYHAPSAPLVPAAAVQTPAETSHPPVVSRPAAAAPPASLALPQVEIPAPAVLPPPLADPGAVLAKPATTVSAASDSTPATPQPPLASPPVVPPARPAAARVAATRPAAMPASFPRPREKKVLAPAAPAGPSLGERLKKALELEEMLGTNLLNKLGIGILVFGVALFIAYKLPTWPNPMKIVVGYATAGLVLGGGIYMERRERYRILARACIGGGWALTYFTTYAMHHVTAARVISSQAIDLVLLLLVAAGMVAHTLRYRSQVATGLAFVLGFSTVTLSHVNAYSLVAGAILAAGLVTITVRRSWLELEIFGLLAGYLNHYYWLRSIIEPLNGRHIVFDGYYASAALLFFYWAVFRIAYVIHRVGSKRDEAKASSAAIVNTALLLGIMHYQSARPDVAFWVLLAVGIAEIAFAWLPRARQRRTPLVVLSTLGCTLLLSAVPFRYTGTPLTVLWLFEAECFLAAGVLTRELVFRRLGALAVSMAGVWALVSNARQIAYVVSVAHPVPDFRLALLLGLAGAILYLNAHALPRHWPVLFSRRFEAGMSHLMTWLAFVAVVFAGCAAWTGSWTAVFCAAFGLALGCAGLRLSIPQWSTQAALFGALAVARALVVNLYETASYGRLSGRALSILLVAALLYASLRAVNRALAFAKYLLAAYTWAAATLIAIVAASDLYRLNVPPAWVALGMALLLLGVQKNWMSLRLQAYAAFVSAAVWAIAVNLRTGVRGTHLGPRVMTVVPVALASFFVFLRLWRSRTEVAFERDGAYRVAQSFSWIGSTLFVLLAWYDVRWLWVLPAWVALGLVLFDLGLWQKSFGVRLQAYLVLPAAAIRALAVNLRAAPIGLHDNFRMLSTLALVLACYLVFVRLKLRESDNLLELDRRLYAAEIQAWFGGVTLFALAWTELPDTLVAPVWTALALVLFEWGARRARLPLRAQAYLGLLLAFGRTLVVNLPAAPFGQHLTQRVLTVLPVAFACYWIYARTAAGKDAKLLFDRGNRVPELCTWLGASTLALLAWYDLHMTTVALAWTLLGIVLVQAGFVRPETPDFRLQAFVALTAAFVRLFLVNFNAGSPAGELSARAYTALPVAAGFFCAYWLSMSPPELRSAGGSSGGSAAAVRVLAFSSKMTNALCWFGTITIAAIMRFELDRDWVAAAWALLAVLLIALSWKAGRIFLAQAVVLGFAVLSHALAHNIYGGYSYPVASYWQSPLLIVTLTATALLVAAAASHSLPATASTRAKRSGYISRAFHACANNPHQFLFFIALFLMTLALWRHMRGGMVTLAWGIEGVAVFVYAVVLNVRTFRLSGLGLLLLCVAKMFVDAWSMAPTDRYVTFIVLGSALLFVSFLYARYRETLQRFL